MSTMNEANKRDFASQMITLVEGEKSNLTEKGFDPTAKLEELSALNAAADNAEIAQQQAAAKAKEATAYSNEKLNEAYRAASNIADLLSGLLGKDSELVKKMRKFRS